MINVCGKMKLFSLQRVKCLINNSFSFYVSCVKKYDVWTKFVHISWISEQVWGFLNEHIPRLQPSPHNWNISLWVQQKQVEN